jgi:hypothetical protein
MSVSMFWQYFSFRQERWDAIFGGGLPGAERHVVASATWDDLPEWDDKGTEFPDPSENLEAYLDAVYRQATRARRPHRDTHLHIGNILRRPR